MSNSFAINRGGPDPLPVAGPVACGGLWAMAAVDSRTSVGIYVAHT